MKSDTTSSAWLVVLVGSSATSGVVDAKQASFVDTTVSDERGDVIEVTVHASKAATVNVGSPADGFWVQVNVSKGKTTLAINTYRANDNESAVTRVEGGMRGKPDAKILAETGPLQRGVYDMNVTVDGIRQDVGSFTVKERETGDAKTLVLPDSTDVSAFESSADLLKTASETEDGAIAEDDQFVLALDVSGLGGFVKQANLSGGTENVSVHFR
ncbi:DUF7827 domain-containing protein [Haladaptatus sp. NG-WS-4]